jgi:small subunit ribosomal protein S15
MLTKRKKQNVIKDARIHETDSGSPEVQVGLLNRRIEELTAHLKKHPKDHHSRRGLLTMVAERRTHLNYLAKADEKRHAKAVKKFKLGGSSRKK